MTSEMSSFQKTAQRSAAVYLEPRFAFQSWIPNRLFRSVTRAFGMTFEKNGNL
jgi:hypothetical protein